MTSDIRSLPDDAVRGWLESSDQRLRAVQASSYGLTSHNVREVVEPLLAERNHLQGEVNRLLHFASLVREARDMDDVAAALEVLDEAWAADAAVAAVEAEVSVLRAAAEVVNADAR